MRGGPQWKSAWWVREFDRLRAATGLELDFEALASGGELDTQPIENMMARYMSQKAECESLERFLDSSTAQAHTLELQLGGLKAARKLIGLHTSGLTAAYSELRCLRKGHTACLPDCTEADCELEDFIAIDEW